MSNPQHEPTMEEILASIRKIISEDAPEGGAPVEAPAPAAPVPVAAAPAVPAPAPQPVYEDVLELTQEVEAPPAPEPQVVEEIVFENVASASHSDIFSDQTR